MYLPTFLNVLRWTPGGLLAIAGGGQKEWNALAIKSSCSTASFWSSVSLPLIISSVSSGRYIWVTNVYVSLIRFRFFPEGFSNPSSGFQFPVSVSRSRRLSCIDDAGNTTGRGTDGDRDGRREFGTVPRERESRLSLFRVCHSVFEWRNGRQNRNLNHLSNVCGHCNHPSLAWVDGGLTLSSYRGANKRLHILLSRTQAGPGRTVKQEQEEISRNHVQIFICLSAAGF